MLVNVSGQVWLDSVARPTLASLTGIDNQLDHYLSMALRRAEIIAAKGPGYQKGKANDQER